MYKKYTKVVKKINNFCDFVVKFKLLHHLLFRWERRLTQRRKLYSLAQ